MASDAAVAAVAAALHCPAPVDGGILAAVRQARDTAPVGTGEEQLAAWALALWEMEGDCHEA